jgi:hypothetical protein
MKREMNAAACRPAVQGDCANNLVIGRGGSLPLRWECGRRPEEGLHPNGAKRRTSSGSARREKLQFAATPQGFAPPLPNPLPLRGRGDLSRRSRSEPFGSTMLAGSLPMSNLSEATLMVIGHGSLPLRGEGGRRPGEGLHPNGAKRRTFSGSTRKEKLQFAATPQVFAPPLPNPLPLRGRGNFRRAVKPDLLLLRGRGKQKRASALRRTRAEPLDQPRQPEAVP